MIVKCNYCGKEFKITITRYNESKNKIFHCCREHAKLAKQEGKVKYSKEISLICKHCNKEFKLKESYYKKQSKRGQIPKYCSTECRIAEQRKNKEFVKCNNCGKEMLAVKNKNILHFCNEKCRIEYAKKETQIITCDNCNKEFEKNKYAYNRAKKHFCSKECYDEYRANKKETYKEISHYLRTHEKYDEWRAKIFKRDKYECSKCGTKKNLHAHHINQLYDICDKYDMNIDKILNSKEFNDIDNGITLCQNCHALEHPYISRDEKGRFISRSGPKSTEDPE